MKITEILQKTGTVGRFVAATPTGEPLLSRKETSNTQGLQSLYVAGKELSGVEFSRLLDLPSQWVDWSLQSNVYK